MLRILPGRFRHFAELILLYLVLGTFTLVCLLPFIWTISASVKDSRDVFRLPPTLIPKTWNFSGWVEIMNARTARALGNTIMLASVSSLTSVVLGSISAYGMSRFRFRGKYGIKFAIFVTQMVPGVFVLITYYLFMAKAGLINTYAGLLIGYIGFNIPGTTMLLHGFFDTIPTSLDEAALIDGCSRLQAIMKVILPMSFPGLLGITALVFVGVWGDLLFATILVGQKQELWPITLEIAVQIGPGSYKIWWNRLAALSILSSIPLLFTWILGQKYIVGGMVAGMSK